MTVPAAVWQRWLNGSMPIVTVSSGRGRSPSAGAVAERIAISTKASARRWVAVRTTPSRRSSRRICSQRRSSSVLKISPPSGSRTPSMATVPRHVDRRRQMAALAHGVGVTVGGIEIGLLLPIFDAAVSNREERGAAQVDEELFGVGELGVAPLPVARGDQIDVGPVDLPGGIGGLGVRHGGEVAGPADQPVGVTAAPVGLAGQTGHRPPWSRRRPTAGGHPTARSAGTTAASNRVDSPPRATTASCTRVVIEGVEVEFGEVVDRRCQRVEQSPSHADIISNTCSRSQPLRRKFFAGSVAT